MENSHTQENAGKISPHDKIIKKPTYKEKFCDICQKTYKDYYQHKRVVHNEKIQTKELCIDCGKIFQKHYIKKHKCSEVIKIARENWTIYCKSCESFHMEVCSLKLKDKLKGDLYQY